MLSQVFGLLVFEMLLFLSLIVPMPFRMKRGLFEFISSNPLVAKLQYGMKVCTYETQTVCEKRLT